MGKLRNFLLKIFGKKSGEKSVFSNDFDYMGAGEALPEPYSEEAEREELNKLIGGDKTACDKLVEHNLRLVVYIARKFENTGVDLDDLISIGAIGLIKAVKSFDPEKKIKLATYASRCIENEILMYLRRISKLRAEVSFDEPLSADNEGNELLLSDVLTSDEDTAFSRLQEKKEEEALKLVVSKLPERERVIVELRYGLSGKDELTQREVADLLGISQSYISRLEKRILVKLKKELSKMV